MVEEKFNKIIEKYETYISNYTKVSDRVGYLRLLIAIGAGYFTYIIIVKGYSNKNIILSGFLYLIFFGLVIYHGKIKEKIQEAKTMIEINKKYLKRISGEWITFKDIGEEFIDKEHPYSSDLDIVGQESIFQLINITSTWYGRRTLAKALLDSNFTQEEILQRQRAIEELKNNLELCESVEYEGSRKNGAMENPERLLEFIKDRSTMFKSKGLKSVLYTLPMITIPVALFILVFKLEQYRDLITIFIVMQLLVWAVGLMRINKVFGAITYYKRALDNYIGIIDLLEKQSFKAPLLRDIYNELFLKDKSAKKALKELARIAERINMRNNGIFFLILNGLFLWDYQCIFSIESWKKSYGARIETWLQAIGEVEALMSISVLNHISDEFVFPVIEKEPMTFQAEGVGHPLISKEMRVNNDVKLDKSIFIITGSNMSGKTTFLRTIGINLVLAYCGGAVCSRSMNCSIMKIYTSMRITDDLKAGISTFYSELMRIKDIIKGAQRKENMIFLIDEIFRGTNSRDRIDGAEAVVKNLNKSGVIGAITTHDMELCSLDNGERVKNYHFEEYYKENKIYFDYKLKEGISTTTNAKYLMRIIGIEL